MVYLNKGLFAPQIMLMSILFVPITIVCTLSFLGEFQLPLFILFLVCLAFSCVWTLLAFKSSKSRKYTMQVIEGNIIINFPNLNRESQDLVLNHDSIVRMEYYRLFSMRGWCMLHNYVLPQCLYLIYVCNGKEICKHIGYPDFQDIQDFCQALDIELIIK